MIKSRWAFVRVNKLLPGTRIVLFGTRCMVMYRTGLEKSLILSDVTYCFCVYAIIDISNTLCSLWKRSRMPELGHNPLSIQDPNSRGLFSSRAGFCLRRGLSSRMRHTLWIYVYIFRLWQTNVSLCITYINRIKLRTSWQSFHRCVF